jgi:hypothetical protein
MILKRCHIWDNKLWLFSNIIFKNRFHFVLLAIVLSVLLRYADSGYPFGIFKLFFILIQQQWKFNIIDTKPFIFLPNKNTLSNIILHKIVGSKPRLGQTQNNKIGICCFYTKYAALRGQNKDWLDRNRNSVYACLFVKCCLSKLALQKSNSAYPASAKLTRIILRPLSALSLDEATSGSVI